MPKATLTIIMALVTNSMSLAVDLTVFETRSGALQKSAVLEIGDELLLPIDLITGPFGLEPKELTANKLGLCRDDICIPFAIGDKKGAVRTIGQKQWVPIERLTDALGGRLILDMDSTALLIDLSPRPITAGVAPQGPIDLTLPNLGVRGKRGLAPSQSRAERSKTSIREVPAPFYHIDGEPVQLASFRGKKVVLFAWASW